MSGNQQQIINTLAKFSWHSFRLSLGITLLSMIIGCAAGPPVLVFDEHGVFDLAWQDYQIELYADGTVHYHGKADVNVIGDRYGKITPEQVQKMVGLYERLYENKQKMLAKYFYPKYEKRYSLDPHQRDELERYKKNYIDRKNWDTSITFNKEDEVSQYAPVGAFLPDFLGILNEMIDMDAWLCYPKNHPRRYYCPILNHSPNYRNLMESINE